MALPMRLAVSLFALVVVLRGQSLPSAATIAAVAVHSRGGSRTIASIHTERVTGHVDAGEESGTFSLDLKRPDKIRLELNLDGKRVIKASDGKETWHVDETANLTKPSLMSKDEKDRFLAGADIDGPFLDYQSKGIKIEPVGTEMLGSSQVWKVQVTTSGGTTYIYDIETSGGYTLMRELTLSPKGQPSRTLREYYRDFRMVKGIPFPFVTISETDSGAAVTLTMDRVDINVEEDDGLFSMNSFSKTPPATQSSGQLP
jgi:outer membrane lipoprotein-sorting protein